MSNKIKKIVAVVAVCALLAGVGVAVAHQGKEYQNKKVSAQQAQAAEKAKLQSDLAAEKAKNARFSTAYDAMRLECEKGRGAHDTLTTLSKARAASIAQPVCGPAVLQ